MERDDTDDSRFTVERLDVVPRGRLDKDHRRLVLRVMDAILDAMDERLVLVEQLADKNKRDLKKCAVRADRYKEILDTYGTAKQNEDLTSVVKYYFALAKSDKLFLAQQEHRETRSPPTRNAFDEEYQTEKLLEDKRPLDSDAAWLASYKNVQFVDEESQKYQWLPALWFTKDQQTRAGEQSRPRESRDPEAQEGSLSSPSSEGSTHRRRRESSRYQWRDCTTLL